MNLKLSIFVLLLFSWTVESFPQDSAAEEWFRYFAGPDTDAYVVDMVIDNFGNVYVTGNSSEDIVTIKYDSNGQEQWIDIYNGDYNGMDKAKGIALLPNGNLWVVGSTERSDGRALVSLRYKNSGGLDVKTISGLKNPSDFAASVTTDNRGNAYVASSDYSNSGRGYNCLTLKYQPDGNTAWSSLYDGPAGGDDIALALAVDKDGNIFVTGQSEGTSTGTDYILIKYNAAGDELWNKNYNGPGNSTDKALAITLDTDRNIYITGISEGNGTGSDCVTIKYSMDGVVHWQARFDNDGRENWFESGNTIAWDNSGNVYVGGSQQRRFNETDCLLLKYSPSGAELWHKRYNGPGHSDDWVTDLTFDVVGNVYLSSFSAGINEDMDFTTIKYDPQGELVWEARYDNPDISDGARAIAVDDSQNVYVSGQIATRKGQETGSMFGTAKYHQFNDAFRTILNNPIVTDAGNSFGSAWGDYNNDGNLDLFVANMKSENNFLYKNAGDGSFQRVMDGPVVNDGGSSLAGTWGDYNNDNDLDLFVVNQNANNFLYQNNGDGTFTKVISGPIVNDGVTSYGCSWGDYDNDGNLDLFVANPGAELALFRNNGSSEFARIALGDTTNAYNGNWADYDNDGDLDLFVANFRENNSLYKNNGDGTFTRVTSGDIVNDGGNSFGASWGDINNDGFLDLFVTNNDRNFLYINNGDGSFNKRTTGAVVTTNKFWMGSGFADFDNDGDLDLYISVNGKNNVLYANNGDGTFKLVRYSVAVSQGSSSRGISWGDYDSDGDADLVVTTMMSSAPLLTAHEDNGDIDLFESRLGDNRNFLFNNKGNENHWINIKCVGTVSNKSAIGTKVKIKATIHGTPVWQLREISSQTSGGYGGQNSLNAEFGLGDAQIVDSLVITWPASKTIQMFTNMAVDRHLIISEDQPTGITATQQPPTAFQLFQNYPNPFNPETVIRYNVPQKTHLTIRIYNLLGQEVTTLVDKTQETGTYSTPWGGKNSRGETVPSGLYLYHLKSNGRFLVKKMLLIR